MSEKIYLRIITRIIDKSMKSEDDTKIGLIDIIETIVTEGGDMDEIFIGWDVDGK